MTLEVGGSQRHSKMEPVAFRTSRALFRTWGDPLDGSQSKVHQDRGDVSHQCCELLSLTDRCVEMSATRIPVEGRVGVTDRCSFRSLDKGKEHEPGVFHGVGHKGNLGTLEVTDPHHGGPNGHKPWPVVPWSWPADQPSSPMAHWLLQ
jgi:hypothetical protein